MVTLHLADLADLAETAQNSTGRLINFTDPIMNPMNQYNYIVALRLLSRF
jgi:hypothetical protein